ncbi:MAG TPA: RNA polymerase sigma-54 factor, partial [Beijerinckiaceae bacterium]|nr:RNA polymerase sigma-54 factor [Beijerinckiaceae bacterium]
MALIQRLEMRQGQSLVMTPQLLQAIKLLQLSHLDLAAYVEAELERNPLLERPESDEAGGEPEPSRANGSDVEAEDGGDHDFGDGDAAEPWLKTDLKPDRADLEGDFDTRLDNVFPDEAGGRERPATDTGDNVSLASSPWTSVGGGGFDGELPDFDATLRTEATLHEHLQTQLDLATADAAERFIGRN